MSNGNDAGREPIQRGDASERVRFIYIDIEHLHKRDDEAGAQEAHKDVVLEQARRVIPNAIGERVWYGDLTEEMANAADLVALVVSGNVSEWIWYDDPRIVGPTPPLADVEAILRTTKVPIVAFCGGHQLMAMAYAQDDSIVDHVDYAKKGLDRETEFDVTLSIELTDVGTSDPIYTGIATPKFRLFHHDEVVRLPEGAICLGSTPFTYFQSLRYDASNRVIYTSQFHPEQDASGFTDGATYLCNFFASAREYWYERAYA